MSGYVNGQPIQHTVAFNLRHTPGSDEEHEFLRKAAELASLPDVQKFKILRQIGQKNNYTFGLTMVFASMESYQRYNDHPDHIGFVNSVWIPEVESFIELDYQEIDTD